MIKEQIELNNMAIERRQGEILGELREVKEAIVSSKAVGGFKRNIAPILLTAGLLIVGILDLLRHH